MNSTNLRKTLLGAIAYVLLLAVCIGAVLEINSRKQGISPGVTVVKLMYEFNNPEELSASYDKLRTVLAPEDWAKLTLDEPLRAVNAYYKFGYESSTVVPKYQSDCSVVYSLVNTNIPTDTLWIMDYTKGENQTIKDVREYRLVYQANGGGGALR